MSNVVPIRPDLEEDAFYKWARKEGLSESDLKELRITPVRQSFIDVIFKNRLVPGNRTGGLLIPYPGTSVVRLVIHGDDDGKHFLECV